MVRWVPSSLVLLILCLPWLACGQGPVVQPPTLRFLPDCAQVTGRQQCCWDQTTLFCPNASGTPIAVGGSGASGDAFNTISNGVSTLSASGSATLEITGATLSGTNPAIVRLPHSVVACRTPINDDNASTDVLQTLLTCTIPANTLTANNCLVVTSLGNMQHNGTGSLTMTVNYGAGTLANVNSNAITTLRLYTLTAQICGDNATNSQDVFSHFQGLSTGIGAIGTMAVDATVNQTLTFTIAFSVSAATNIFNQKWGGVRVE